MAGLCMCRGSGPRYLGLKIIKNQNLNNKNTIAKMQVLNFVDIAHELQSTESEIRLKGCSSCVIILIRHIHWTPSTVEYCTEISERNIPYTDNWNIIISDGSTRTRIVYKPNVRGQRLTNCAPRPLSLQPLRHWPLLLYNTPGWPVSV